MAIFLTDQLPGRTVQTLEGKEYLWFSGTDYLGMAYDRDFQSALKSGFTQYGTHFGSSRNGNLRLNIYSEAEAQFAGWQKTEAALLVSSGMLAGQLLMRYIAEICMLIDTPSHIQFHYAPKVHPAIWGSDYQPDTREWKKWAQLVVDQINADGSGTLHIICSDAIGSPLVEQFDFSIFDQLTRIETCRLIIDQSHSLGVSGQDGLGIGSQLSQATLNRTIFVSSLNKALGIPAGVIWGEKRMIDLLGRSAQFAGASPAVPAYIFAFKNLLENGCYKAAHSRLEENIQYFFNLVPKTGNLSGHIAGYPVFCAENPALYEFLLANGILVSSFSYPLPTDIPVTRIAINAAHQKEDLDRLAEVCIAFLNAY